MFTFALVYHIRISLEITRHNLDNFVFNQQVLDSFFLVLSDTGDVFFVSENVYQYLGYTQVIHERV